MTEAAPVVPSTAETTTPESTPEAAKAPETPSSSKLLDLAKKEASFIKKEVEYKKQLETYQKQVEELSYFQKAKDIAKQNPEELLSKLGITYDELTQSLLDYQDAKEKGQKTPSVEELRKEITKEFEQREAKKIQEQASQAIEGFGKEIDTFLETNIDKFPYLQKLSGPLAETQDPGQLVFEVISNYYDETGELLDLDAAAASAEEYFREEWNKLNGVLSGVKPAVVENTQETKAEVSPVASSAPTAPAEVKSDSTASEGRLNASAFKVKDVPTITNNMRPTSRVPYKGHNQERRDIIDRAVAALEAAAKK